MARLARSTSKLSYAVALFGAAVVLLLGAAPYAAAEVERSIQASDDPNGQLIISPGRVELDVEPGEPETIRVTLFNNGEDEIDVTVGSTDLGAASNPRSLTVRVEENEFGAGEWLESEIRDFRLKAFERIEFDVTVTPPSNAPSGTSLGAISIDATDATGKPGTADFDGAFRVDGLIQCFFTYPVDLHHELKIEEISLRDRFRFNGKSAAVWEIRFKNDGNVNEHVSGAVTVRSLFGNSAERYKLKDILVLRGATRTQRIVWPDVPWVGAFHPEVRVRGDDAKVLEDKGGRLIVVPWWIIALIVGSIIFGFVVTWWRRRLAWEDFYDDTEQGVVAQQQPQEQPEWAGDEDADAWDEDDADGDDSP